MSPADLRAMAKAAAEAHSAYLNALCDFAEQAQIDRQREFGAVNIAGAMELLGRSRTCVQDMVKDGRLFCADGLIPLWSIHDLLHKTQTQRRKNPALRAVGRNG